MSDPKVVNAKMNLLFISKQKSESDSVFKKMADPKFSKINTVFY